MNLMLRLAAFLLLVPVALSAQNIFTEGIKGRIPTVRFEFENKDARPSTYQISLDATGDAEYFSREEGPEDGDGHRRHFQVSKPTRDRIFELTAALRQFRGDFEFRKHRVAFSGLKTFTYTEGFEEHRTSFNWSENKDATELAALFQGIAATIQAETRLVHLRKHDKLGLDAELKHLEQQARSGFLKEIGLISKVLLELKSDPTVMTMARNRADRLLKLARN